jgi:type IV pilus biogenesis protein CpaD/CtpE
MNSMQKPVLRGLAIFGLTMALGACNLWPASAAQDEFGSSVRQTMDSQKANPVAAGDPDLQAVDGVDGVRLQSVLETYRGDVGAPAEVKRDLVIDLSR